MKPFDLEKALAGEPVVTRGGLPVTQLVNFDTKETGCIYGVCEGFVYCWDTRGSFVKAGDHTFDLFMAPKTVTLHINVYIDDGLYNTFAYPYKDLAEECARPNRIGGKAWKLEIEE